MVHDTKTAIITGGGQGIGLATAERFLARGVNVVLAEVDVEAGAFALGRLNAGERVRFIATDVADEAAVRGMIEATVAAFGRVDYLINNVGINRRCILAELTLAQWRRVLDVNLTGAMLCSKYAEPHLRAAKGAIVNLASVRALMSEPNDLPYVASKAGLIGLTHALAMTLGPDVRVNCISPGWVDIRAHVKPGRVTYPEPSAADHAQHPGGRLGQPADIAAMITFLCSEEAGFITAENFVCDGGMLKKMRYVE